MIYLYTYTHTTHARVYIYTFLSITFIKKKQIPDYNLMFCLLGPKDSIVYYNDGEPNLQGKCNVTICYVIILD